ncbi:hypothetical protein ACS0TY_007211 [Phlomoides rotata]
MVEPSGISYRLLLKMHQKLMVEVVRRLQPSEWRSREEATSALDQLHEVEKEVKSLRTITQRMILTRDEMSNTLGRGCSQEVLACSVREFMCTLWYSC